MAMQTEAKRVKIGRSLIDFEGQATSAINVLRGIRMNLTNLKTSLQADTDFTQADTDEVDTMIAKINTAISKI